ncbi:MAG: hypothetical protein H6841_11175 [Planctomycetes bacterium]|nr:hypothetical protein [Planctomycetota bacterium]MCB9936381.1 hypothetical protein [Planctomycetota bacterium]
MEGDPNFRLKAFAVIACVLGVFLVSFVAQRVWYWMKTRRREDVDTSRVEPIIDFGLLGIGLIVIWMAIEALVLSVLTSGLQVQPRERQKIAEIEIGKLDEETGQLNLLFYPVDRAGRRLSGQRRPVLTSGHQFELIVEVTEWRSAWTWLGEGGFYQFVSLGGYGDGSTPENTTLEPDVLPRTAGATLFLRKPQQWEVREPCEEGDVYDIYINPQSGSLEVVQHPGE